MCDASRNAPAMRQGEACSIADVRVCAHPKAPQKEGGLGDDACGYLATG